MAELVAQGDGVVRFKSVNGVHHEWRVRDLRAETDTSVMSPGVVPSGRGWEVTQTLTLKATLCSGAGYSDPLSDHPLLRRIADLEAQLKFTQDQLTKMEEDRDANFPDY